jgi:hypothetical protein
MAITPKDIGREYVRGIQAGRERRKTLTAEQLRDAIKETKREIKRVGSDYNTGPFLVGLRDGLEGA